MNDDMFSLPHNYATPRFDARAEAVAATDGMETYVFGAAFKIVATSILILPFAVAFPPLIALLVLAAGWNPEQRG
jgi:F0F1-type ATP synthase assembly protein I